MYYLVVMVDGTSEQTNARNEKKAPIGAFFPLELRAFLTTAHRGGRPHKAPNQVWWIT